MNESGSNPAQPSDRAPSEAPPGFTSLVWRAGDAVVGVLARLGIGPVHLLTTRGRRTGASHTKPVVPVEYDDSRWLVAPYGAVAWVKNVRADPHVTLRHGSDCMVGLVREVAPEESAPVLKRYLAVAPKARRRFRATEDSPVEAFVAEAPTHPVFLLTPTSTG